MNNLGWTTIEQSKKLVKAGLDPNTADMFYIFDPFVQDIAGLGIGNPEETGDIPCWSLGVLINLMQPFYPVIESEGNDLWNISICATSYLFSDNEGYDIHIKEKLLVDACVKTIIVLIEHNEIKQEETK